MLVLSSAEYFRFEADEEEIAEDGRSGVVGGGFASSSLVSGSPAGTAVLLGPGSDPIKCAFAIAPCVCCEGRNACTPLTVLGIIACIQSKCGNPFCLKGFASLFF